MTTPAHTRAVAEVLAAHQHERNFWECTGGDHHTYQGELPARRLSHAEHQADMLAAAGLLADPAHDAQVAAKALREAADGFASGQITGMFAGRDGYTKAWLRDRADLRVGAR